MLAVDLLRSLTNPFTDYKKNMKMYYLWSIVRAHRALRAPA